MEYTLSGIIQSVRRQVISPFRFAAPCIIFLILVSFGCRSSNVLAPSTPSSFQNRSTFRLPTPTVLSVFPFEDRTLKPELAWLRTGLVDMVVGELAGHPSLAVVQRERVDEIIREQTLQVSGRVSDRSMVKIGRLIGANVVMTGRLIVVDDVLLIHAQFVSVEQGAVLGAVAAEGPMHDATNVARRLVDQVRTALLDGHADATSSPATAQNGRVEGPHDLRSREGKLFEALKETEHTHALHQTATPQFGLEQPLPPYPSEDFPGGTPTVPIASLNRLVERFATGLEAEIGMSSYLETNRGGMLTVPVTIRFSSTVDDALHAVEHMLRVVRQTGGGSDIQVVVPVPSSGSSVHETIAPRRFYLRLLSRDGRTIAVYSDFKEWNLSNWITVDTSTISLRREHVLQREAQFTSLTAEQSAAISSVRMTLDRVPHERATVRIDAQTISDANSSSAELPISEAQARRDNMMKQDAVLAKSLRPLRTLIEEVWSPPIYERAWIQGYTPSNERTSVITCLLDPLGRRLVEVPRLVRSSGEEDFDRVALSALNTVLLPWLSLHGFDSLAQPNASPSSTDQIVSGVSSFIKLRVQFVLRKDVPALNLVGPEPLNSSIQRPSVYENR